MITIVSQWILRENQKENFKNVAAELVEKSGKEEGNHSYHLFEDLDDPNVVAFIEEWENQAALEAHKRSAHFASICPQLRAFQATPSRLSIYQKLM